MSKKTLDEQIIDTFFQMHRLVKGELQIEDSLCNLTLQQIHLLLYVMENKQPQISELAKNFGVSVPTMTVNLDRVVTLGYAKRIPDATDKRVMRVVITEMGMLMLKKLKNIIVTQSVEY